MSLAYDPDARDVALGNELRTVVLQELDRQNLNFEALAERLGMLPIGAKLLLDRPVWPLDVAVRVADAVEISVELRAAPQSAAT